MSLPKCLSKLRRVFQYENYKLLLFIITWIFTVMTSFSYHTNQNKIYEASNKAYNYVETAYSNIQRITKLELENMQDDYLIIKTENIIVELLAPNKLSRLFPKNSNLEIIILNFVDDWETFCEALVEYKETNARDKLFFISEHIYDESIENLKLIKRYIDDVELNINNIKIFMDCLIVGIILFLFKAIFNLNYELKLSKELSNDIHIDTATGLYDRVKCQEILRNSVVVEMTREKERAFLIVSLDSYKSLNKKEKKKTGRQIISSFATELKDATKVFPYEVFVGRYGIDEFIVFFDYVGQQDIDIYIEEVRFLIKKFNQENSKLFELSCSIKYAITTEDNRNIASRELFHLAQKNIYENKIII
ncbi:MAG: diguanylate cyclase [bacterium]